MNWIDIKAEGKTPKGQAQEQSASQGRHTPIEELEKGKVFSISNQAQKFEFTGFDNTTTPQFPKGRIVAKTVNSDGSYGADTNLDYGQHKGMDVIIWNSIFAAQDSIPTFDLFERIQVKGGDTRGIVLDVDKSQFPDCGVVVMWEQPLNGESVSEVPGHSIESLGEQIDSVARVYGSSSRPQSLAEIRETILDLRGKYDEKCEDKVRDQIQKNIEQALKGREKVEESFSKAQKEAISKLCSTAIDHFSSEFKAITDACVLHVTAGVRNYELDQVSLMLPNYADRVYHCVASLTNDPSIILPVASEILGLIADSTIRSYYLTRPGFVRQKGDKWEAVLASNEVLDIHATKKKAINQIRTPKN